MKAISSTSMLRKNNRNCILQFLSQQKQGITKQQLAVQLGMSLPTITQNILELEAEGFIFFAEKLESSGGRKPKAIVLNKEARYAVGIAVFETEVHFTLLNLHGEEVEYKSEVLIPEKQHELGLTISYWLDKFIEQNNVPHDKILGVSLALDAVFSNNYEMANKITDDFKNCTRLAVITKNIVEASAYAEYWHNQDDANLWYLQIDHEIKASLLLPQSDSNGNFNNSFNLGNISIDPHGKRIEGGVTGSLDSYCSTYRLSKDLNLSLTDFFARLANKDDAAQSVFTSYLTNLGRGIATLQTIIPCNMVIGGVLAEHLKSNHLKQLRLVIKQNSPHLTDTSFLQVSHYKDKADCTGAALLHITRFLEGV